MTNMDASSDATVSSGSAIWGLPAILGLVSTILIVFGGLTWHLKQERARQRRKKADEESSNSASSRFDELAPKSSFAELKVKMRTEPNRKFQPGSYLVCAVCLETIKDEDDVRQLPCGHVFHSEGIERWFKRGHQCCPLCKSPLCVVTSEAVMTSAV